MMDLSIIIVNWNAGKWLKDCLDSVRGEILKSNLQVQIIVVDNASQDSSREMLAKDFPEVLVIANSENLGFAKGNNQALKMVDSRMILFLNPDTLMKAGVINSLFDHLKRNFSVGAVGPLVLNPDGSIQVSAQPFPTLFREIWRLFHLDAIFPISCYPARYFLKQAAQPADVLLGACILARKAILDKTGNFDEQFFVYSEEVDLCLRIRRAGWEIHWLPEASIVHYGGMSTQQVPNEMFLELYRNKIRFFRKHYGDRYAGVYKGVLWLASVGRLSVFKIIRRISSSAYHARTDLENQYTLLYKNLPSL